MSEDVRGYVEPSNHLFDVFLVGSPEASVIDTTPV